MLENRGQASLEALLILAAILVAVTSLQAMGENSFRTPNAISSARHGVQTGITRLTVQNEVEIIISDWGLEGDNIVYYLTVQGAPPPENGTITSETENIAKAHLGNISSEYNVEVKIEKRVRR